MTGGKTAENSSETHKENIKTVLCRRQKVSLKKLCEISQKLKMKKLLPLHEIAIFIQTEQGPKS